MRGICTGRVMLTVPITRMQWVTSLGTHLAFGEERGVQLGVGIAGAARLPPRPHRVPVQVARHPVPGGTDDNDLELTSCAYSDNSHVARTTMTRSKSS